MDGRFEVVLVGEGLIGEMMRLEVAPLDIVEFLGVLCSHSTASQWAREANASCVARLLWIGPLSSVRTTGVASAPGLGP